MIITNIASRSSEDDDTFVSQANTIGGMIGGLAAFVVVIALCATIARHLRRASRTSALTVVHQPIQTPGTTQMTIINNTIAGAEPPPPYTPPAPPQQAKVHEGDPWMNR
ncbi:hypothetical protein OH77DRAFT_1438723 [Trametes cingulata]|nr:hypothetical protein OH77DRAFT_1438723 [Trametes cingulata]